MGPNPSESKETQFHHFICGIKAQNEIIYVDFQHFKLLYKEFCTLPLVGKPFLSHAGSATETEESAEI